MRIYLRAYAMCRSMFCAIPFPGNIWDEDAREKLLLFLPLVGLEMGILWALLGWATRMLELSGLIRGLLLSLYPFLVTGFLHLDGFMDVTDAVRSWRDLERRREILKDSHVGSFAVIGVAMVLLCQFVLLSSVAVDRDFHILCLIPVVSRCCSALAVTALPPMSTSQYAKQKRSTAHIVILALQLAIALGLGFALWGRLGFVLIGCLAGYGLALGRAYGSLRGMNGDISGYALTIGELCALAVYALI